VGYVFRPWAKLVSLVYVAEPSLSKLKVMFSEMKIYQRKNVFLSS
jgi:hypothetical protein